MFCCVSPGPGGADGARGAPRGRRDQGKWIILMGPPGRDPVALPPPKPTVAHLKIVLCRGSTLKCIFFSALNKLKGIKGDRGPAGTNGDKGEKVGPQPPIGLIHLSVNIPVNLWSHHFLLFNGIHTAVQLKVVSLSVFTGPPRATRTPGGRWPSRQCCTLHFRLVLMGSMGHWGWYYTILSLGIGDDTRWLADS